MKRFISFVMLAVAVCSCNMDISRTADAETSTKSKLEQEDWLQTISAASDDVKQLFLEHYSKNLESPHPFFYEVKIDPQSPPQLDVYGIPIYTVDSALWVDQKNLPLESYLCLDAQHATFFVFVEGKPSARLVTKRDGDTWKRSETIGVISPQQQTELIHAFNANEKIIAINVRPRNGSHYIVLVKREGQWIRIDGAERYADDAMEELRTHWTPYIIRGRRQTMAQLLESPGYLKYKQQ